MLELFGLVAALGGAMAVCGANAVKAQTVNRGWVLQMQSEVLEAGVALPNEFKSATGKFAGRAAALSLSLGVAGMVTRRFIVPHNLTAEVECNCPLEFALDRTKKKKYRPKLQASFKPVDIQKRDVIDSQTLGKPQLEQILAMEESAQLRTFSSNSADFRQWQANGCAGDLLYELLYVHSADSIVLSNKRLQVTVVDPTTPDTKVAAVKAMLQTMIALAADLEAHAPTR